MDVEHLADLIARVTSILQGKELYKKLLKCNFSDAQRLLDSFQQLLDLDSPLDPHFLKDLTVATQRIAAESGLYPTCYELKDVVQLGQHPVAAGGFADIYKGTFRGQVVCLKTIRLYQKVHIDYALKKTAKEAILWRQLQHPNILTLFGLYLNNNDPRVSIVTLWMDNGDIRTYLKKKPTAPRRFLVLMFTTQSERDRYLSSIMCVGRRCSKRACISPREMRDPRGSERRAYPHLSIHTPLLSSGLIRSIE
ncbi:hypothetical protein H0H87_012105 [Tephrocybe sp. NHM501043]|nr:hypothetical protein H0H87_012105 [Tephrocybe sp. NHM501043]